MSQEQMEILAEQKEQIWEEIFCMCTNYLRNHSKEELDEIVNHAAELAGFFGGKGEKK